jgi:hypothetical protein
MWTTSRPVTLLKFTQSDCLEDLCVTSSAGVAYKNVPNPALGLTVPRARLDSLSTFAPDCGRDSRMCVTSVAYAYQIVLKIALSQRVRFCGHVAYTKNLVVPSTQARALRLVRYHCGICVILLDYGNVTFLLR